jgi:hypothetical protein
VLFAKHPAAPIIMVIGTFGIGGWLILALNSLKLPLSPK